VFGAERVRRGDARDGTRERGQRPHFILAHDFVVNDDDAGVSAHERVVHRIHDLVVHALCLAVREPRDVAR